MKTIANFELCRKMASSYLHLIGERTSGPKIIRMDNFNWIVNKHVIYI